jgi:hypothetical protein
MTSQASPNSPPPEFQSRETSPVRQRHVESVNGTLADTFDTNGSDDEDNDGDDRQRLMRNSSTTTTSLDADSGTRFVLGRDGIRRPVAPEPTITAPSSLSLGGPPASNGRVYGAGSQSDGVFANLAAKPEGGEKVEEHPPVSQP